MAKTLRVNFLNNSCNSIPTLNGHIYALNSIIVCLILCIFQKIVLVRVFKKQKMVYPVVYRVQFTVPMGLFCSGRADLYR